MNTSKLFVCAVAFLIGSSLLWAANQYKCPKCGLVLTYDRPGVYKCPQDGYSLVPKW